MDGITIIVISLIIGGILALIEKKLNLDDANNIIVSNIFYTIAILNLILLSVGFWYMIL